MIDLAQSRATVLIAGRVAMVLDGEGANFGPALLDVGYGIFALVVHYIPGVIADAEAVVIYFVDDAGAVPAGRGVAAMLLDHDGDAVAARGRRHTFQRAEKCVVLTGGG